MKNNGIQPLCGRQMLLSVEDDAADPLAWAAAHKKEIDSFLSEQGVLLIRGLDIPDNDRFGKLLTTIFGQELAAYTYRSTPRTSLANNVYTATEYHASEEIPQHNENSYSDSWPMRLGFLCTLPAPKMGNTPISDSRTAYREIPAEIRDEFHRKKIMYVRNYSNIDLPWTEVFQTTDKWQVEHYCSLHNIDLEWTSAGLRTRQVSQAVMPHPVTGELLWFNQAHLFHISNLGKEMQEDLVSLLGEPNLPRNALFGDGTDIDPAALDIIRQVYRDTKFSFQWQKNDLLLLDNMLYTHGREPYEGPRKVLVGMAKEFHA